MSDELKQLIARGEAAIAKVAEDVRGLTTKASEEVRALGVITAETSAKISDVMQKSMAASEEVKDLRARLNDLEQAGAKRLVHEDEKSASPGSVVVGSEEFKELARQGDKARSMREVTVGSFHKAALVNATGLNQPLVPGDRQSGIVMPGLRAFRIRDLIPAIRTASNMIEFARENSFTNAAEPQYSSPNVENVLKAESALSFTLENEPVRTLAHWIPASRQVLQDAPMLQGYIDTRLTYGMKLKEEDQLLNGNASGANLNGLLTQASAYDESTYSATGDTEIDTILRAMNQVALSEYNATGIVLHPTNWTRIRLLKDNEGRYVFGDPHSVNNASMWGLPVVATQSMTLNHYLVGAFAIGATIFDKEDASVRIAEQHADFFVKNMVAILAEERLALVVYRATSFVTGTFEY